MELVSITSVQPGQVIARAVTNAEGAVLCPSGFRLTETAIRRLHNAGVESVVLEQTSGEQRSDIEARLVMLEERFKDVDDPILLQIKAVVERRLNFRLLDAGGA